MPTPRPEISPQQHALSILSPGRHPATDGGVHFHFGAGEDAAIAAKQPTEKNHTSKLSPPSENHETNAVGLRAPVLALIAKFVSLSAGAERLVSQEEACGREGRGDRLPGHPGGGEDRRPEEGDDRAAAAAGERALGQDDTGRSGEGASGHASVGADGRVGANFCSAAPVLWQMRALDAQLYPEKLKAIAQQVQDQQSLGQLQQHEQLELDSTPAHSPQVGAINMAI